MTLSARILPLTEVIYGLIGLTLLRHKELKRINRDKIYLGVKALSEHHPECFPALYFAERGSMWHSKDVEDTLFRLAGVLCWQGIRYQHVGFNEGELDRVEKKLAKWFDSPMLAVVARLADEFYEVVKGE